MQTSTKASIAIGALAWLAGQVGEGRAFMDAAETMNRQIEADRDCLHRTGTLPEAPPLMPLTGSKARSKVSIAMRCWAAGSLLTWTLVALPFILATALARDPHTPIAAGVVGGLGIGFAAGIFVGWLPGAIIFMITGSRENNRRSRGVVLDHFVEYWRAREKAAYDLAHGADPRGVATYLVTFTIAMHDDSTLFGAVA